MSFLVSKGVSAGVGFVGKKVKAAGTNYVVEQGKTKILGQEVAGVGDQTGKTDFRHRQMFADPKPTGIVSLIYGSRVIEADDLDLILQAQKGFLYNEAGDFIDNFVDNDNVGQAGVEDDKGDVEVGMSEKDPNKEGGAEGGEMTASSQMERTPRTTQKNDDGYVVKTSRGKEFKSNSTVNKPITMTDIRSMVDFKAGASNKGFVRFEKTNKGKGVKLGKVGDFCDWFMSRRINVTKEHNRQLRNLFAETMLHDFGGVEGLESAESRKEQFRYYGAVLEGKINDIRAKLLKSDLNRDHTGDMVGRKELKSVIDSFDKIFTVSELDSIVTSFLEECVTQTGFPQTGTFSNVGTFLNRYGKYSGLDAPTKEGIRNMFNFTEGEIKQLKSGDTKLLLDKLNKVSDAFSKMSKVYKYEHAVKNIVDNWGAEAITIQKIGNDHLQNLKGLYLDKLNHSLTDNVKNTLQNKGKGGDGVSVGGLLNMYFNKVFDTIQDVYKGQLKKVGNDENAKSALKEKIIMALSYDKVYENVENFINKYSESVKSSDLLAINDLFAHLEKKIGDAYAKMAEDCKENGIPSQETCKGYLQLQEEYEQLQDVKKALGTTTQELKDKIKNTTLLKGDEKKDVANAEVKPNENKAVEAHSKPAEGDENGDVGKAEEKVSNDQPQNPVKTREWDQSELIAVIKEGSATLDNDLWNAVFVEDFLMDNFGEAGFQKNNLSITEAFDGIFKKYEENVGKAITINTSRTDDINITDFVAYFSSEIVKQVDVDRLKNDYTTSIDKDKTSGKENANNTTTSLKVFLEGMVKTTVDYLVKKKGDDENFKINENITDLRDKTTKLAAMLAKKINDVLSGNIIGLKSFVNAGKMYTMKGAIAEDEAQDKKNRTSYIESVKEYIYVDLIRDFLAQDVPGLLMVEDLEKFGKQAEEMFGLRADEVFSKMENTKNGEFYSAILEFETKVDTENQGMMSLVKNKNKKTGYTGTDIVPRGFREIEGAIGLNKEGSPIKKRAAENKILKDDDLIAGLKKHSEELWRAEIVNNAPGKGCFEFIDFLKFKLNNWIGRSNFVDIDPTWIKGRQGGYEKAMTKYVDKCIAFETKLKTVFTQEITNALKARPGGFADKKHLDILVATIRTGCQPQMEALFRRYIDVPDFHKDDKTLVKLVRNALGFDMYTKDYKNSKTFEECYKKSYDEIVGTLRAKIFNKGYGVNETAKAAMLTRMMEKGPKNIVETALSDDKSKNSNVIAVDTLKRVASIYSFKWAIEASVDKAMSNPIAAYERDANRLNEKLADWAANSLKRVSKALLGERMTGLLEKCCNIVAAASEKGLPETVQVSVENRLKEYVETFAGTLCDIVSRTGKASGDKVDELVDMTLNGFEKYVAHMNEMVNDKTASVWVGYTSVFQTQISEGIAALGEKGATAKMMAQFVLDCEAQWQADVSKATQEVISKSANAGTLENGSTFNELTALAEKANGYKGVKTITDKYVAFLGGNIAYRLNMDGMKALLEKYGISKDQYPDNGVYESILASYLADDKVVSWFTNQQMAFLNKNTPEMETGFDEFIKSTIVPNFNMVYPVKSLRADVERKIASIEKNASNEEKKIESGKGQGGSFKMGAVFATFDNQKTVRDNIGKLKDNIEKLKEDLKEIDGVPLGLDSNVQVQFVTKDDLDNRMTKVDLLSQERKNLLAQGHLSVFKERVNKSDPDVLFVMKETLEEIRDEKVDLEKITKDKWIVDNHEKVVARLKLVAPDAFAEDGDKDNISMLRGRVLRKLQEIVKGGVAKDWKGKIAAILTAERPNVSPAKEDCEVFDAGLWDELQKLGERAKVTKKGAEEREKLISSGISAAVNELNISGLLQKRFLDGGSLPWHMMGENSGTQATHLNLLINELDPIDGKSQTMLKNLRSALDDENLVQKIYSNPKTRDNDVKTAKEYLDGIISWNDRFESQLRVAIEAVVRYDNNKRRLYLKGDTKAIGEGVLEVNKGFLPKVFPKIMHGLLDGYLLHIKTSNSKKA